jgi:uncharacterized membrane protein
MEHVNVKPKTERLYVKWLLTISLFIKAFDACVEILTSIAITLISHSMLTRIAVRLTRGELAEDPTNAAVHYILDLVQNFSGKAKIFAAVYLVVHGIVKLLLVIGLFKKKLWVYPVSIVIFALFSAYEVYRFFFVGSLWLLVLAAFDLIVIWLVWTEYTYLKKS